ncbi:MAG: dTDP-4-dehydrorhamnose 3,5-epimerase [Flavobacteriales bacterium]|nr:dTDP-4-dehydrorhamnose 3,5-epimerase [Flavobacteriales bacterium]
MEFVSTEFEGLIIVKPKVFMDERGYFFESFNKNEFKRNAIDVDFVQDNQSKSDRNVLRGLHFQNPPFAQGKLVQVIKGAVLDVVVDIRKNSTTYGKHFKIELSEENKTMLFIPPGFAHGFLTLLDETIFSYKCSNFYNKESEKSLLWNDKTLNIDWDVSSPILSEKDKLAENFQSFISPF